MITEWLAWLIDATVATTLAALAVLVLRKPLRRWLGAEIACRLWIVVPFAAIAAAFSLPQAASIAVGGSAAIAAASSESVLVTVAGAVRGLTSGRWLLAVWFAGGVVLLAVFVLQQRRHVQRLRLRRERGDVWRSHAEDATPSVLGVLRQRLVLPADFESVYADDERRLVLAHERMHQQRRDPWALAGCALLRVLFWFNPVVQWAATRFRRDIELACDAAVLRTQSASRQRYATALLKAHVAGGALPVGCRWNPVPPMKERIMLLNNAIPSRRARVVGAILIALAALGATGLALATHASARQTADALATPAYDHAPFYKVALDMRVDGKPVAHPTVIARAGDEAMVKIDENGNAWGLKFHIAPGSAARGPSVRIAGDVYVHDENHVIGHPDLGLMLGKPGVIELNDPRATTTRPVYRVNATVTLAPPPPPPPMPPLAPRPPVPPSLPVVSRDGLPPPPSTPSPMAPMPPPPPMTPPPPAPPSQPMESLAPLPPMAPPPPANAAPKWVSRDVDGRQVTVTVRPADAVAPLPPPPPDPDLMPPPPEAAPPTR